MSRFSKITALLLSAVTALTLASCADKSGDVNESFTVYNNSEHAVTFIVMAPTEDALDTEDAITLLDQTAALSPKSASEVSAVFPEELYKGEWVMEVYGVNLNETGYYNTKINLGDIFNITEEEYSKEVWGFRIDFDSKEEEFSVTPLDGSDI